MAPAPQATDGTGGEAQLPHLFSPLRVGPHLLRNRVLVTAHVPRLADDGAPGARYVAYQRARLNRTFFQKTIDLQSYSRIF